MLFAGKYACFLGFLRVSGAYRQASHSNPVCKMCPTQNRVKSPDIKVKRITKKPTTTVGRTPKFSACADGYLAFIKCGTLWAGKGGERVHHRKGIHAVKNNLQKRLQLVRTFCKRKH
jgi:hypothetical protein